MCNFWEIFLKGEHIPFLQAGMYVKGLELQQ